MTRTFIGVAIVVIVLPLWGAAHRQTPATPLRLDIKTSAATFRYREPIKVAVTLTNTSQAPARIMKPGVYFRFSGTGDVVSFRIERADGIVAEPRGNCLGTVRLGSPETRSIELAPGANYQTALDLWNDPSAEGTSNPTDGATLTSCWSYYFGKEYNAQLKPGQYRISLTYKVPATGNPR